MNQSLIPISATPQYTNQSLSASPVKSTRKQASVEFQQIFQQVRQANSTEFQMEYQKVKVSQELNGSYLKQLAYEDAQHKPHQVSMQGAVSLYTANSF